MKENRERERERGSVRERERERERKRERKRERERGWKSVCERVRERVKEVCAEKNKRKGDGQKQDKLNIKELHANDIVPEWKTWNYVVVIIIILISISPGEHFSSYLWVHLEDAVHRDCDPNKYGSLNDKNMVVPLFWEKRKEDAKRKIWLYDKERKIREGW